MNIASRLLIPFTLAPALVPKWALALALTLTVGCACLMASVPARAADSMDLLAMYRAAKVHDAIFQSAQASFQAGLEKLPQARSLLLPKMDLSANTMGNDVSINYQGSNIFESGASRFNSRGYILSLTQPLFRLDNWINYSEAEIQITLVDTRYRMASQDLILRVTQAYFDLLSTLDELTLAKARVTTALAKLEQSKLKVEMGTGNLEDVYDSEANVELARSDEIEAQENSQTKAKNLQKIAGQDTSPEISGLEKKPELPAPSWLLLDKWLDSAQHNNLDLVTAQANLTLAEKEVTRQRDAHYPTVDLVASKSRNTMGSSMLGAGIGMDMTSNAIGVQLNLPIYAGGMIQSRLREAQANRLRAMGDLENVRGNVNLQTRQAYLDVINGMARIKALEQVQKSRDMMLSTVQRGRGTGTRDNLDVLRAQESVCQTHRDLQAARYHYLLSELRLKQAVADLNEADLAEINSLFH